MKKTKYWQVPDVHFNTIQDNNEKGSPKPAENLNDKKSRKFIRYTELRPTVSYLLRRIG